MTYDPDRGVSVMLGGSLSGTPRSDLWEWDGITWRQIMLTGPGQRVSHALAYDSRRHACVLAGGTAGALQLGNVWDLQTLCTAPVIDTQPVSTITCPGHGASFAVTSHGTDPRTYQWQIQTDTDEAGWRTLGNDPFPLPCGGGAFAAASPPNSASVTVSLSPCAGQLSYALRCRISNFCGTTTSNTVTLTICAADFNCDGLLNTNDFFDFVAAFFSLDNTADFDHSGLIDSQDFFSYVAAFFTGC